MENANPPLTPDEVALLRSQIENEISDLRELNSMIDVELDHAFNDLKIAIYSDNYLERNNLTIEELVEKLYEEEIDPRLDDYFNLYPTKEEIAYYNNLVDNPRPPFVRIDPKIKRGDPGNVKIPCMIGYLYVEHAYIDCESPINVMSSSLYSHIMNTPLEPRKDPKYPGGVCNFVGRVKNVHIFVGNFTFATDFMILEDLASVIDCRLSPVVLGKTFVEVSNLKHDRIGGTVQFSNDIDRITYRMLYWVKNFVLCLD